MQKLVLIMIAFTSVFSITSAYANFNTLSKGNVIKCTTQDLDLYFNQKKNTVTIVRAEDDGGTHIYKIKKMNSDGDTFVTFSANKMFDLTFDDQGDNIKFFDSSASTPIDCN